MCRRATIRVVGRAGLALLPLCVLGPVWGQGTGWRHVGNSAIELALPSAATGPVDRVWYSLDGLSLFAKTAAGRVFRTADFEQWQLVTDGKATPPTADEAVAQSTPEAAFKLATPSGSAAAAGRLYGIGGDVYRSDDAGVSWANLTSYQGACLLGPGPRAVTVSPMDPEDLVVASDSGVWRSLDGGVSWIGLNQFLPNLPAVHLLGLPSGTRGVRLELASVAQEVEWAPGEKSAWKPVDAVDLARERNLKSALSQVLKRSVTAIAAAEDYIYAGDSEGRLQVSADAGVSWGPAFKLGEQGRSEEQGKVAAIWVDADDPRVAVAVLGARSSLAAGSAKPAYVLRTMNGGSFWDDITANLPENAAAHGVAADRGTGAIYIATDAGLFATTTDLGSAGRPTVWTSLSEQLPAAAAVTDVRLDAGGNQLFTVLDGYGVYTTIAPHRLRDARIVNAADYSARPTAPGALLSVLGARVESARSEDVAAPVLDATETASQIQVPFEAKGDSVSLSLEAASGPLTFGVPLKSASPAIFVDPEGTPLIMDAASGVLLDASKPARASSRIQVLATGLGQVKPDWPTGLAAPLKDPPRVAAAVHAYLDGSPVEVTQASLAPFVGFYLIEIQMPRIADTGPAELYIEAEGQQS